MRTKFAIRQVQVAAAGLLILAGAAQVASGANSLVGTWGPVGVPGSCVTAVLVITETTASVPGARTMDYTFDGRTVQFTQNGKVVRLPVRFEGPSVMLWGNQRYNRC
jgi:hypothetical protein